MRRLTWAGALLAVAAVFSSAPAGAQDTQAVRLQRLIEQRLQAQQPISLSAEKTVLTGDTLRLIGDVWIRWDAATVRADEAVVHRDTNRIELSGKIRGFLRHANVPPPVIEYR